LGLPETDWRVRRFAVLSIAYEGHEEMLASGRGVEAEMLLKLDEAMQAIRATIPPPRIRVDLMRSHGRFDQCPECGFKPPEPEPYLRDTPVSELEGRTAFRGVQTPPEKNREPTAFPVAMESIAESQSPPPKPPPPPKPFHETYAKDTRPNAPRSLSDNRGSLVWFGNLNSKKEGF
jgi:hypothetical protein